MSSKWAPALRRNTLLIKRSVAKDRAYFKTYTPFSSTVQDSVFTSPHHLPALEIGTVEIPTKRSPNLSGVSSHGSLHLKQVLHVPGFKCNVLGGLVMGSDGYTVETCSNPKTKGGIRDSEGKRMAYFVRNAPLFSIKVRNQPGGLKLGPFALKKDVIYMFSCHWDDVERKKWLDHQIGIRINSLISKPACANSYTDDEKLFLKRNWRNEYNFLRQYGLSIYKDEDREEGRSILRTFMHESESESEDTETEAPGVKSEDIKFDYIGHRLAMLSFIKF
ncbi:hypothetical protein OPT61_g2428 [Boeremia exigua]|uniref:Uncharacterized protein n=1 Tax=Boeremia exigua TaxID=749465 RepID=A0ACC2ILP0_9PLEO|nr:hypothetical protein OPT61_g2428 [Boeremia exigua]